MTAQEKIDQLYAAMRAGKKLYFSTAMRTIVITQATVDKFVKANRPVLTARGNSMYLAAGQRYDCIDYCRITTD